MHPLIRFFVACVILTSTRAVFAEPLVVADRTCLFLDDHFIAEQSGLKRTFHQGKPHPKAVVSETEPWEQWICLYGGCFYDPFAKVYRMYYQTTFYPSGVPGVSFRQDICYAESKDAVTWTKPKLGLVDFKGSKDNNELFFLAGPMNAFMDPKATDAQGRMKANLYFLKADPKLNDARGMTLVQSADGLNWSYISPFDPPTFANPAEREFVDMMALGWDGIKNKYICNWRVFSQHSVSERPDGKRRAIGVTWSDKLLGGWSPAVRILTPDERDDQHAARLSKDPNKADFTEFYTMPISTYGNHYLGFVTLFEVADAKDCNGGGGLQMAFSNDGLKWTRPEFGRGPDAEKQPRLNAIENSDDPGLFPNFAQQNAPLDMGDETWIFYSENNGTHGMMPFEESRGRIRAAVWRKDGFASLDCAKTGTLVTKPLVAGGKELIVNFETEKGGSVLVGMLDEKGQPISQFNLGECESLIGDATAHKVVWVGGSDFSNRIEQGKPVRIMFELNKAKLWSFRFQP